MLETAEGQGSGTTAEVCDHSTCKAWCI